MNRRRCQAVAGPNRGELLVGERFAVAVFTVNYSYRTSPTVTATGAHDNVVPQKGRPCPVLLFLSVPFES